MHVLFQVPMEQFGYESIYTWLNIIHLVQGLFTVDNFNEVLSYFEYFIKLSILLYMCWITYFLTDGLFTT